MPHSPSARRACSPATEEALSRFLDGELSFADQPPLFQHLAVCEPCRRQLDGVMAFRRIVREDNVALPPAADDAFLKRLAAHKRATDPPAPAAPRRPVWRRRTPVSPSTAVLVGAVVFLLGLLTPIKGTLSQPEAVLSWVKGEEELVEFDAAATVREPAAVYVFYPGLTVEATKGEPSTDGEVL